MSPVDSPDDPAYSDGVATRRTKQDPFPYADRIRRPVNLTLDPNTLADLDAEAEARGMNRSHLVEEFVREGLTRSTERKKPRQP